MELNNPLQRMMKTMENDPLQQVMKAMENDPLQRMMKATENDPLQRMMKAMERQAPELLAFQKQVDALQRAWPNIGVPPGVAFQPPADAIVSLSAQLAHAIGPYQSATTSMAAWEADLAARMARLEAPWAISNHLGQSMIGFARLARLGEATHAIVPYAEDVDEFVTSELGSIIDSSEDDSPIARDAAAIDAGLNPELIAFPSANYSRVVFSAGFEFSVSHVQPPQAVEAGETCAVFDPVHGAVLIQIEQRLRQLVEERLRSLSGANWIKQRVSTTVSKRWMDRQGEDRDAGRPVYTPIQYADFMDLVDIIGQANNWRDAFEPVFRNRDDFAVSLRRLHPIRKAVAHSRPIGRADTLTLVSEATRLLGALGERTLV
jgi:hypothetical protein